MSQVALGACLGLIAFGVVGAAASILVLPAIPRRAGVTGRSSRALVALRLAPATLAAAVAGLWVLPGFVWLEPQESGERVTPLLAALALSGAAVIATGAWRATRALLATRALARRWRRGAAPIARAGLAAPAFAVDDPFPVVAVAGILRPRLFVARRVIAALTPAELDAVLDHEAAHLRRRDNLARLLLRACPDLLAWSGAGARLERAFGAAAERESDAEVGDEARRLDLASALVKVARLAEGRSFAPGAAAAFHGGDPIADRVRRLLDPPAPAPHPARRPVGAAVLLAAAMLVIGGIEPELLRDVHGVTERFVRMLQ